MNSNNIFDEISKLPLSSRKALEENITLVRFPKGHILLKAGKIESNIYFIKKGIVRAYVNQNDSDVTFWFGKEGETILSMRSYVENQKGYEDIELLEDCDLYELKTANLQRLFEEDISSRDKS